MLIYAFLIMIPALALAENTDAWTKFQWNLFKDMDIDKSGYLIALEDGIEFAKIDKNINGVLDVEEIHDFVVKLCPELQDESKRVVCLFDRNTDGQIDALDVFQFIFGDDKDGDFQISRDEFGIFFASRATKKCHKSLSY